MSNEDTLAAIVRDLAAHEPLDGRIVGDCVICDAPRPGEHADNCPWLRAHQWAQRQDAGGPAPEHLTPVTSDRGFDRLPPIEARHGATVDVVSVAEASTATAPHVWLRMEGHAMWEETTMSGEPTIEQGPLGWMMAHLTLEQARILEEQLAFLRTNHYHHQLGDHHDTED